MAGQLAEKFTAILRVRQLAGAKAADLLRLSAHAASPGDTGDFNPLAIRRVEHHHTATLHWGHALQGIATPELNHIGHPGALGIALGKVHHAVRHIAAVEQLGLAWLWLDHGVGGLLLHGGPLLGLEGQVFLKRKMPARAGGDVAGNLRGLNHHGAAAAAGVVQRHQVLFARGPAAGGQHGGG